MESQDVIWVKWSQASKTWYVKRERELCVDSHYGVKLSAIVRARMLAKMYQADVFVLDNQGDVVEFIGAESNSTPST